MRKYLLFLQLFIAVTCFAQRAYYWQGGVSGGDWTTATNWNTVRGGTTGTAVVSVGVVTSVTLTRNPAGYTIAPTVTFTGGSGSGATGTANLDVNGRVSSVTITNGGTGYSTTAPTVTFTGVGLTRVTPNVGDTLIFDGTSAQANTFNSSGVTFSPTGLIDETISYLILTSREDVAKTLILNLPNGTKTLTVINDLLISYGSALNDGGNTIKVGGNVISGSFNTYNTSTSSIAHAGTGKIEFTGTNTSSQSVLYATRTNNGSGYSSAPTVVVGTPWTANTAFTAGQQLFYGPINSGTNGSSLYTVIVGGTTGDATTAPTTKIGGEIHSGTAILRWVGFAAKATCASNGSSITSITVTCPGSGYTSAPAISFTGGGGSGATATSTIIPNCYFLLQAGNIQFDANTNYNLCFSGTTTINGALNLNSGANLNFNTRTLTLGASASITLAPKANLNTTSSTLTLNSRTLTLQSDATGTATLVDNNTNTPPAITATVQQYLGAARNWYISSPITAATVPTGQTYYKYDETGSNTAYSSPATGFWAAVAAGTALTAMKGYIAQPAGVTTLSYTGTLNTGSLTIPLTRTAGKTKEGFNLVGNPYPSYLDWSLVDTTAAKVMTSIWYRTKTLADTYTFDTYNGKLNVATTNGATTVTKLIPPMQAFWVRVKEGETVGTLTFTNAMRKQMDNTGNLFKFPREMSQKLLRLKVSNGINSDETIICFNPDASNSFDSYDSPKMSNANTTIPEIYTIAGKEQLVINGLNSIAPGEELTLGFSTGALDSFSIKASQVNNFENETRIIIKDKVLNAEKDITDGSSYNYTSEATNTINRFSILFRSPAISTGIQSGNDKFSIEIFKDLNNQLVVRSNVNTQGVVTISNAVGQMVYGKVFNNNDLIACKVFKPGVYFVTVMANGFKRTKKIIL